MPCIAFDSHEHYTWALVKDEAGEMLRETYPGHDPLGFVPAEPDQRRRYVPLGARSDLRHVTRTTDCCLDSEELAYSPRGKHVGVRQSRTPGGKERQKPRQAPSQEMH